MKDILTQREGCILLKLAENHTNVVNVSHRLVAGKGNLLC